MGAASTFDPIDQEVVLFGGFNATAGALSGATWTFRSGTWTELCSSCGPGAREYASMAFDASDGYVLLYGGFNGAHLGDAWSFRSGAWSLVCSTCAPPARSGGAMAFDALDGVVLLVGGCGSTCPLADVWTFSAGVWTQQCAGNCPFAPRDNASMAYDAVDGVVVLTGGWTGTLDLVDTWTYRSGAWTSVCDPCAPAGRHSAALTYDSTDGFLLLFGGENVTTNSPLGDTWEFFANTFSPLSLPTAPPAAAGAAMADDPLDGLLLLVDGQGASPLRDAWGFFYGLVAATPVASPFSVDNGQPVSLSGTVTGGTAPLVDAWSGLPTGCTSANSDPLSCTPTGVLTNTTFSVRLEVSDARGVSVQSPPLSFTVTSVPAIGAITPSLPSGGVDAGQNLSFSVGISGGAGGYTFAWSGLPIGCGAPAGRVMDCVPVGILANTSFSISVRATDASGLSTTTANLTYVIDDDPIVATPSASVTTVEVGSTVTFQTTATSGAGSYRWSWWGLPPGCFSTNSPSLSCMPRGIALNITSSVTAQVIDANGEKITSAPIGILVVAPPTVSAPTPSSAYVDDGQTVSLSVVAAGGSGNYTLQWLGLPSGCASANAPVLSCTPSGVVANTTFQVQVNVTDGNGVWSIGPRLFLQVDALPQAGPVVLSSPAIDAGMNVTLSVTVSGGAGDYTFSWTGLPQGCSSQDSPVMQCRPSTSLVANSTFPIGVTALDAAGYLLQATKATLTVDVPVLLTNLSATPTALDVGQTVDLSVSASGGAGGYVFSWWGLPTGCASADAPILTCSPTVGARNASYPLWVTATDANGLVVASMPYPLEVDARPAVTSLATSVASIDLGQAMLLTAHATFGSGTYAFHWTTVPPGCTASNAPQLSCVPSSTGTWVTQLTVTDSRGPSSAVSSLNLTVVADPTVVSFYASASPAKAGQNVTLTVVVAGGIGPYAFSFTGLPPGCSGANTSRLDCVPELGGTFTVRVDLTDARGLGASAELTWQVVGAPGPGTLFGLPAYVGLALLGAAVAAIVLVVFIVVPLMRRTPGEAEAASEVAEGGPSETETEAALDPDGPTLEDLQASGVEQDAGSVPEGGAVEAGSPTLPPTQDEAPVSQEVPSPPGFGVPPEEEGRLSEEMAPPPLSGGSTELVLPEAAQTPPLPPPPSPEVTTIKKCPLCGSPLAENNVCRACELDWSKVQIQGRTDTLKGRKPRT